MGKRKSEEELPGGEDECHVPKTKQSLQEDPEAMGDNSLAVTRPAQPSHADGKPQPATGEMEDPGETICSDTGSAVTNTPRSANGDREAAALEQSREGERVPSPLPQEGGDTDVSGGGNSPEAASQPVSPQRARSVEDGTEEHQLVATTEQTGEEPHAETPTHRGTGDIGDSPERGSAPPARGEGAASREDPPGEEEFNRSELGERQGDADRSQEPNAEENESGAVSERAAAECRENVSEEQPQETGTNDAVKNAAESWCSLADSDVSAEVLGVCAEPESVDTTGTISPVSQTQNGNNSPQKISEKADTGQEEAGEGETLSRTTSSASDLAVPTAGNAAGEREGEGLTEEHGMEHADTAPRMEAQPPAPSGELPGGGGTAESAAAITAMPEPPPMGAAEPPATGTGSAVGAAPPYESGSAGKPLPPPSEPRVIQDRNGLELPPQQPLPAADRRDSAVPRHEPSAAAGQNHADATPTPLTEGNGAAQPWHRAKEPAGSEDATDVICGLIRELSNLNRLAMGAHRGLEALRRPKPRRSRWPVPAHGTGRRRKET